MSPARRDHDRRVVAMAVTLDCPAAPVVVSGQVRCGDKARPSGVCVCGHHVVYTKPAGNHIK